MTNEQILLFKDKEGKYIPYNRINNELCVLIGDKKNILERVKESINKYYGDVFYPIQFINKDTLIAGFSGDNKVKYTLCSTDGKILCGFVDSFVKTNDKALEGDLIAYSNDKISGFINVKTGKMIETNWKKTKNYSEGLAAVQDPKTSKWGYVNENMDLVIDCKFDKVEEFTNNMAVVSKQITNINDLEDNNLNLTIKEKEIITKMLEHETPINVYGYINKTGELVIPYKYAYARNFSEDMAFTTTFPEKEKNSISGGAFIDKNNKRYCYFPKNAGDFHYGMSIMRVDEEYHHSSEYFLINKMMQTTKVNYEYLITFPKVEKFNCFKQENYRIEKIVNKQGEYKSKLINKQTEKEINFDYYPIVASLTNDFYENGKIDGNIYAFNFITNRIVPLTDFIIGSRNILAKEEAKPYIKKKSK